MPSHGTENNMLPVTSLGKLIARGRTAEIYAWNAGYVLKLFFDCWPADRVDYEARMARAVHASGLPVPAVGEIVEIRGRLGVLFERVDGPTMLQTLAAEPRRLPPCARLLAELHADMHSNSISLGLPLQRRRLADKIQTAEVLSNRLREAALKALETLPDGDRLCHGDFHPGNVIMTVRGPMLIDWPDATHVAILSRMWREPLSS